MRCRDLPTDAAGSAAFPERKVPWGRECGGQKAAPEVRQTVH